jgi:hypothetical protein
MTDPLRGDRSVPSCSRFLEAGTPVESGDMSSLYGTGGHESDDGKERDQSQMRWLRHFVQIEGSGQ